MKTFVVALLTILVFGGVPIQTNAASKLSKTKITIAVGRSCTLKSSEKTNKKWKISKKTVAGISSKKAKSVKITGRKAGKAVVSIKIGKKTYRCNITVVNPKSGNSSKTVIHIGYNTLFCVKDKKIPLFAQVINGRGKTVWKSSNEAIATVSADGTVEGIKIGTVNITAINNGVSKSVTVTVIPKDPNEE